jgi:hypothetical protein
MEAKSVLAVADRSGFGYLDRMQDHAVMKLDGGGEVTTGPIIEDSRTRAKDRLSPIRCVCQ